MKRSLPELYPKKFALFQKRSEGFLKKYLRGPFLFFAGFGLHPFLFLRGPKKRKGLNLKIFWVQVRVEPEQSSGKSPFSKHSRSSLKSRGPPFFFEKELFIKGNGSSLIKRRVETRGFGLHSLLFFKVWVTGLFNFLSPSPTKKRVYTRTLQIRRVSIGAPLLQRFF